MPLCFIHSFFFFYLFKLKLLKVHIYLNSIVPFAILLITNTLLIARITKTNRKLQYSHTINARKNLTSKLVITMTFSFIILTLPASIAGSYFLNELLSSDIGTTILFLCDCLIFSYSAYNIIFLTIANKQFFNELLALMINKCQVNYVFQ